MSAQGIPTPPPRAGVGRDHARGRSGSTSAAPRCSVSRSTATAWCGTRSGWPRRRVCTAWSTSRSRWSRTSAGRVGVPVSELAGVGIGLPGVVDADKGLVEHAVNLGIERSTPLAALVAERLGVQVRVENDLTVAVVGAAHTVDGAQAVRRAGRARRRVPRARHGAGRGPAARGPAAARLARRRRRDRPPDAGPRGAALQVRPAGLPGAVRLGLGARRRVAEPVRSSRARRAVRGGRGRATPGRSRCATASRGPSPRRCASSC